MRMYYITIHAIYMYRIEFWEPLDHIYIYMLFIFKKHVGIQLGNENKPEKLGDQQRVTNTSISITNFNIIVTNISMTIYFSGGATEKWIRAG